MRKKTGTNRKMRRGMKRLSALALALALILSGCGTPAGELSKKDRDQKEQDADEQAEPLTEKEVKKLMRAREKEYLAQREEEEDSWNSKSANGGIVYEAAVYEEAAADAGAVDGEYYEEPVMLGASAMPDQPAPIDTAEFTAVSENGFMSVQTSPFSTFAADTDTASYSLLRMDTLTSGRAGRELLDWMDKDAIRIEEMINYFDYDYDAPGGDEVFSVTTEVAPCPWNDDTELLMVGVKAKEVKQKGGSNIVLLIDTSGSMFGVTRLGFVQEAMKTLIRQLSDDDRISIVTYAGYSSVLADGVRASKRSELNEIIDSLEAGGSTNGGEGIITAYELAKKHFVKGGTNRVILCTDGDLNVGVTSEAALVDLIEEKREDGVFLSVLGVGYTNYSDSRMEALADHGNGNYAYIDCLDEAERVLEKEFTATTVNVAKDVKFQVEFNPALIKGYRQIGYENRAMAAEDFADDTKDGGEVGSGQTVTVLYEIVPVDSKMEVPGVTSKYSENVASGSDELLTVNLRYKAPDGDKSELREYPVTKDMCRDEMSDNLSWAAGVAQTGMLLRESAYAGTSSFEDVKDRLVKLPQIADDDWRLEFLLLLSKFAAKSGSDESVNW